MCMDSKESSTIKSLGPTAMPYESNVRSRSISLRTATRRSFGNLWESAEQDGHLSLKNDHDSHDDPDTARRSEKTGSSWLLIILMLLLVTRSDKQILFDNYLPTAVYGLYICGGFLAIIGIGNVWANSQSTSKVRFEIKHLSELVDTRALFAFVKTYRYPVWLLVGSTALRIFLQIVFFQTQQCFALGIESFMPLVYVAWTKWGRTISDRLAQTKSAKSVGFGRPSEPYLGQDVKIAILLGLSLWTVSNMVDYPQSTMICEASLAPWIRFSQLLSIVLDVCIITSAEICFKGFSELDIALLSGWSLLASAACLASVQLVLIFAIGFRLASGMEVFEGLDEQYSRAFRWELLVILLGVVLIGRLLSSERVMTLLSAFSGAVVISNILPALSNSDGLSFADYAQVFLVLGSLLAAFASNGHTGSSSGGHPHKKISRSDYIFYFMLCLAACTKLLGLSSESAEVVQDHPIDNLIYAADQAHEAWIKQAKQSQTLEEAIVNYQNRYNRQPPPNFHIWYNFAIARNSDVIDDFDSIERDLAPFRALSPAELRARIKEAVTDTYNEIGVIKVRGGKPILDRRFRDGWMMDARFLMMEYFIHSLPDMDIPFNIQDEPRVVVPYDQMQELLSTERPPKSVAIVKDWSSNTAKLLDKPVKKHESTFEDWSFRNNFQRYSTLACPPDSAARRTRSWLPSRFCTWCAKPHSTSEFVEDWDHAKDPCHQPDLATLHGFYQGPGAYKVTKKLLPVFSASKPHGYADILYPSIWDWDDGQRLKYSPNKNYPSPDYSNKSNTLFWRGSTLEGYARGGKWRTFSRQRFVYMTNKGSQSLPVYLPESSGSDKYTVEHLTKSQLLEHPSMKDSGLKLDTGFTAIERAWEDKSYELNALGTVEKEDFQANWQHKYLVSMDEASASTSFIPLVQSNCLPFRATIFNEWFDDRLTPWKHFVPVDLRYHGLWSTLAYFAGRFGTIRSVEGMDAGEFIAESGRLWGSRTLRRDDMEIYFFRLLLEWGRLIDDRRDDLGFQL